MDSKHKELIGTSTRIVQNLSFSGYVVREADVTKLDGVLKSLPVFGAPRETNVEPSYLAFYKNGDTCRFQSAQDLLAHPNTEPELITGLEVTTGTSRQEQANVLLEPDGDVTIDITGPSHIAEGAAHTLRGQLKSLNQEYPWAARFFVLNPRFRRLCLALSVFAALFVAFHVCMYVYAHFVGVSVDPKLIPEGMSYYREVEKAINSSDLGEKLNVLLKGHYERFINVTDFLIKYRVRIGYGVTVLAILFVASWVSRRLVRYYPRAFFALGAEVERYKKLEKGRELWVVAVIIGFIVNVAAAVAVLMVGK